jgi:hypothetical protein
MANIPGTSGPVDYPNRPEGDGGNMGGPALPGGSARAPEAAPETPGPQQGAGSGSGGLYPHPDNPGSGAVMVGYKGGSYTKGGSDEFQPPANAGSELVTGGQNGSSVGALSVPTSFTKASTNQG